MINSTLSPKLPFFPALTQGVMRKLPYALKLYAGEGRAGFIMAPSVSLSMYALERIRQKTENKFNKLYSSFQFWVRCS
jgi:hypothetical protein